MFDIAKFVTIALAVIGGITLCTLVGVFLFNLRELFERVDDLEETVRKHGLVIREIKKNGPTD